MIGIKPAIDINSDEAKEARRKHNEVEHRKGTRSLIKKMFRHKTEEKVAVESLAIELFKAGPDGGPGKYWIAQSMEVRNFYRLGAMDLIVIQQSELNSYYDRLGREIKDLEL